MLPSSVMSRISSPATIAIMPLRARIEPLLATLRPSSATWLAASIMPLLETAPVTSVKRSTPSKKFSLLRLPAAAIIPPTSIFAWPPKKIPAGFTR
jgi:hypothetical protein